MKKHIAMIFGGKSPEHEVSLRSAKNIVTALDKDQFTPILIGISKEGSWYRFSSDEIFSKRIAIEDKNLPPEAEPVCLLAVNGKASLYSLKDQSHTQVDCAFPILHGPMGEDGTIQGLFKMVQLPFVGCGVWSSAAGMDKEIMKRLLVYAGVPVARYELLTPHRQLSYEELVKKLGSPFFIKPANAGSSVGVHKIKTAEDFPTKLADAFQFDNKVLAEEFVQGRELECSVLGHNESPRASLPGEVIAHHEFYSYEAKYVDAKGADTQIPAKMTDTEIAKLQELAKKTFTVMGCEGLTRVDFFMKKDGEFCVNEINTLPGFTKISMYPQMWEASGLSYTNLITELIHLGIEKHAAEQKLKMSYLE